VLPFSITPFDTTSHKPKKATSLIGGYVLKTKLLINPSAGRGRARKIFPKIQAFLHERKVAFSYQFSRSADHLSQLTVDAIEDGCERIVVCGGDGSMHQVVNAIIPYDDVSLGVIPCGRGDDFARSIGVPIDIEAASEVVARGSTRRIDVAKIGDTYYTCVASIGLDAEVNRFANEKVGFLTGKTAYIYAVLRTLSRYTPKRLRIVCGDHSYEGAVSFVAVANTPSYGGGMKIAPLASVDDGLLDVIIVENATKLQLLRALPLVLKGKHLGSPLVKTFKAKDIQIASGEDLDVFADGEFVCKLPVHIEIVPRALTVIV